VLLLWVYYTSQIFLFGAELARAYAKLHGSKRHQRLRRHDRPFSTPHRVGYSCVG
jgi:uncharacterized BrkB/YihY/UPF0761 family membrane protein